MAKFLSTPPADQSPGMAIQENPYSSDRAGGYNFLSGDYELSRDDLWSRLLKILRGSGQKAPSKQEFDAYYDSTVQGAPMGPAGTPMAQGEQDWRMMEGAPALEMRQAESEKATKSEVNWQRMLESLKASAPKDTGALPPLPPPSGFAGGEPKKKDYATNKEYVDAYMKWQADQM